MSLSIAPIHSGIEHSNIKEPNTLVVITRTIVQNPSNNKCSIPICHVIDGCADDTVCSVRLITCLTKHVKHHAYHAIIHHQPLSVIASFLVPYLGFTSIFTAEPFPRYFFRSTQPLRS